MTAAPTRSTGRAYAADAVTYTPHGPVRASDPTHVPAIWRLARDVWQSRDMIVRLVRRDVQSRYRQFYLGSVWVVLQPAITIAVFLVLTRTGVLNAGQVPVPYPLFALVGITIWQLFATGVTQGTSSLAAAGPLLIKVNVSKAALVVASLGTALVEFAVRLVFIALVYAAYRIHPSAAGLLGFLVALLPLFALTVALALAQAILGVVVRDVATLVPTVLGLLLFLMPVLYATPRNSAFARVNAWNPLYHLVCGPRDLLVSGHLTNVGGFVWSTVAVLTVLALAGRLFHGAQYKIAERA
ncbi:MAG TPA: ABC transporter permease [Gemmatimonadaceae bacterium]|nr:ABC transporter permease [Gemmatimonadaceae bacterium]